MEHEYLDNSSSFCVKIENAGSEAENIGARQCALKGSEII